jgi:hypothetical protein
VAVATGAGIVIANAGGTDSDTPLAGTDLERATQAALEHTGGGTVIESEIGDDGAGYGIEIRRDDGRVIEVNLDAAFNVIGSDADHDGAGDRDGPNDQ